MPETGFRDGRNGEPRIGGQDVAGDLESLRQSYYELAAGRDAPPCSSCGHEADDHDGDGCQQDYKPEPTYRCPCPGYEDLHECDEYQEREDAALDKWERER
jgi:hypothetical protein